MQPDVWYKASDLMNVLGVRETRTKELLRALITDEKLVDDGATKGKRYKQRGTISQQPATLMKM